MTPDPEDPSERPLDHQSCTSRSFLVQLRLDTNPATGTFRGRVQHIRTGDAAHFDSLDELAAYIFRRVSDGR